MFATPEACAGMLCCVLLNQLLNVQAVMEKVGMMVAIGAGSLRGWPCPQVRHDHFCKIKHHRPRLMLAAALPLLLESLAQALDRRPTGDRYHSKWLQTCQNVCLVDG